MTTKQHILHTDIGTITLERSGKTDIQITIDNGEEGDCADVIVSQNIGMAIACLLHSLINDDDEV